MVGSGARRTVLCGNGRLVDLSRVGGAFSRTGSGAGLERAERRSDSHGHGRGGTRIEDLCVCFQVLCLGKRGERRKIGRLSFKLTKGSALSATDYTG